MASWTKNICFFNISRLNRMCDTVGESLLQIQVESWIGEGMHRFCRVLWAQSSCIGVKFTFCLCFIQVLEESCSVLSLSVAICHSASHLCTLFAFKALLTAPTVILKATLFGVIWCLYGEEVCRSVGFVSNMGFYSYEVNVPIMLA